VLDEAEWGVVRGEVKRLKEGDYSRGAQEKDMSERRGNQEEWRKKEEAEEEEEEEEEEVREMLRRDRWSACEGNVVTLLSNSEARQREGRAPGDDDDQGNTSMRNPVQPRRSASQTDDTKPAHRTLNELMLDCFKKARESRSKRKRAAAREELEAEAGAVGEDEGGDAAGRPEAANKRPKYKNGRAVVHTCWTQKTNSITPVQGSGIRTWLGSKD